MRLFSRVIFILLMGMWGVRLSASSGGGGGGEAAASYDRLHVVGSSKDRFHLIFQTGLKHGYFFYEELTKSLLPHFSGIAYGAGGGGCPSQKTLVNFHSFDCVTFVETYWAISRTLFEFQSGKIPSGTDPFLVFSKNLNRIRYFGGENCGIEYRIHYFTQQMEELDRAGFVFNVANANGVPFKKKINYISSNPNRYGDMATTAQHKTYETILSATPRYYYPMSMRAQYYPLAKDGDLIAFSSVEPGLDVSHCGLITVEDQRPRLNHASEKFGMVVLGQDLDYYLTNRTKVDGFFVYRPRFD